LEENEEGKGLFTGTADSFLAAASASATEPKALDAENAANVACEASDRGETETESAPAVNKSPSPSVSRPTVEVSVTAPASSDPLPKGASDDVCAEEEDPPSTVASSALSTLTRTVSASSGTSPFLRPVSVVSKMLLSSDVKSPKIKFYSKVGTSRLICRKVTMNRERLVVADVA